MRARGAAGPADCGRPAGNHCPAARGHRHARHAARARRRGKSATAHADHRRQRRAFARAPQLVSWRRRRRDAVRPARDALTMASPPLHDPLGQPLHGPGTEVRTTTCYMCACRCGIRVHLRDGEVRYIDGNPDHPLNKGIICAKGGSGHHEAEARRRASPGHSSAGRAASAAPTTSSRATWDEAFALLETRLRRLRATDPKRFALFTGRDQMQALTGLFARQFGTPNYAAHGGFCSVNMAAGMIYTIGGSFWEFGGPDLDRARLFVMIGTAEDHHSNPLKAAIAKFKRGGGRFIAINPVRTGYAAIADEWVPIRPGTDGALLLAIIHELVRARPLRPAVPRALHQRRPAGEPGSGERRVRPDGAQRRRRRRQSAAAAQLPVVGSPTANAPSPTTPRVPTRRCWARSRCRTARRSSPRSSCWPSGSSRYTPEWAAGITGIPAATIRRLAHEIGVDRARPEDRAADRLDRLVGREARHGDRQPGRLPRDARARGALQRLPDDPRAGDPDVAAGHHRPARGLPPSRTVSARGAAQRAPAQGPAGGASRTRRSTARRWAGRRAPTISSSTSRASRCASTRASPGSIRCRRTG